MNEWFSELGQTGSNRGSNVIQGYTKSTSVHIHIKRDRRDTNLKLGAKSTILSILSGVPPPPLYTLF